MPSSSFTVEKTLGVKSSVQITKTGVTKVARLLSTEHCIKNSKKSMAAKNKHGTHGAVNIISSRNPKSPITAHRARNRAVFRKLKRFSRANAINKAVPIHHKEIPPSEMSLKISQPVVMQMASKFCVAFSAQKMAPAKATNAAPYADRLERDMQKSPEGFSRSLS